ncbi:hypothetical protein BGW80DRAFT_1181727, partial [Lactifluus volemus]
DNTPRVCPKCHNVTVVRATSRLWFSLFLVRLVPFKKKHIWICSTCNWHVPIQNGWEPALPAGNGWLGPYQQGTVQPYQSPNQMGYQPSYDIPPHGY